MENHKKNCDNRFIQCSYCSDEIIFKNKDIHYERSCSAFWKNKREELEKQLATEDGKLVCEYCSKR